MTRLIASLLIAVFAAAAAAASRSDVHVIRVVDDQTGRGVPLVCLETTDGVKHWTDSAGVVAFDEPGLLNRRVWFGVKSTGYQCPTKVFDSPGVGVDTKPGATTEVKLKRINIAERLYRVTGIGIYRDSVRAGLSVPTARPVENGLVTGQDSVQSLVYRGKMRWFWGDTGRVGGPLGQFAMSGAVSELPGNGGLDPSVGVDLTYFVDKTGFSRPMMDVRGDGPKWAGGMMAVKDPGGRERLVCSYVRVKGLTPPLERALALYNDERDVFERWKELSLDAPLYPNGQPFRVTDSGAEYFYFPAPYAITRVEADWDSAGDVSKYEAWTCLKQGGRYAKEKTVIDRDVAGKPVWGWKRDTAPVRENEEKDLIKAGVLKESEAFYRLRDVETGKRVTVHGGSVAWNAYRKKYVMLFTEFLGGPSLVGEVWLAESDRPEGPYVHARKVATHEKMDFYNPVHHPEFDQQGGRIIYFEGTYTNTFSGNPEPTPRYNYNQLMYRLDLSDPRLKLDLP